MKRRLEQLLLPISRNPLFYIGLIALFSISIIFIEYGNCSRSRACLEMFGDVYILCTLLMLIPAKLRKWVKYVLFSLLYLIGMADMLCYQIMGIALVPIILQTWLQTNIQESTEVLHVFLTPKLLITPVALLLLLALFLFLFRKRASKIPFKIQSILFLLTLASIILSINNKMYLYEIFSRSSEDDMEESIEAESMTHDYLPVLRLALSMKEVHRFSNMRRSLLDNVKNTKIDSCSYRSPLIVLIIGESYNRHHASLYDYQLPTTPYQKQLYQEGKLYRFNDVISSYNLTYKSFQNMLTLYNYDSKGMWYHYPILPALFRKAGYKVSFFSNQSTLDKSSAFTDYSEDIFISNPEISHYMFDQRNTKSHEYDMELIDDYLSAKDTTDSNPQLLIFQFIGIHADFSCRYPKQQAVFTANDYQRPDLSQEDKEVLSQYDNALVYNDKVIKAIIRLFSSQDAIIIYVPDHGELVYDGVQEMGRTFKNQREYVVPQFDIPFWIYCSDLYKEKRPVVCKQIEQATNRPFMTDDLPHLLLYLAGIHCKGFEPNRNLIDNHFNEKRRRIIKGETDYDKL